MNQSCANFKPQIGSNARFRVNGCGRPAIREEWVGLRHLPNASCRRIAFIISTKYRVRFLRNFSTENQCDDNSGDKAADVSHVVVDGRVLIDEGELVMLDEDALLAEAEASARSVFLRAGVESRLTR